MMSTLSQASGILMASTHSSMCRVLSSHFCRRPVRLLRMTRADVIGASKSEGIKLRVHVHVPSQVENENVYSKCSIPPSVCVLRREDNLFLISCTAAVTVRSAC